MVTPDRTAKLLDFGLAKFHRPEAPAGATAPDTVRRALTEKGTIMGTPGYLAPEQAQGLPADARADVLVSSLDGARGAGHDALLYVLNTSELAGEPWHLMRVVFEADHKLAEAPAARAAFERLLAERDRPARERLYAELERSFLESAVVIPVLRMPVGAPAAVLAGVWLDP